MSRCNSPTTSQTYQDLTSPPPTPRKRVYPSQMAREEPPIFFPCNQSVYGTTRETVDKTNTEQLFELLSTSTFRLNPRPRFNTEMRFKPSLVSVMEDPSMSPRVASQETSRTINFAEVAHLLPPPPSFAPSVTAAAANIPSEPIIGASATEPQVDEVSRSDSDTANKNVHKLPTIQRSGMRKTVDRRNSMVARCA